MSTSNRSSLRSSAIAAYGFICVSLVLLLVESSWTMYRDLADLRSTFLDAEIARLQSHAERLVGRLEHDLNELGESDLVTLSSDTELGKYWTRMLVGDDERLYAAIVDYSGAILLHSDSRRQGGRLTRNWYERVISSTGDDVVETNAAELTGGKPAIDIRMPITLADHEVGEYHVGLDLAAFDKWLGEQRRVWLRRRGLTVAAVALTVLLAGTSLAYIGTHSVFLRKAVRRAHLAHTTEVSQLAAGLAHEIRNPLHAIRLNLHTFRQVQNGKSLLPNAEVSKLLDESTKEIERIDVLLQQLLGFATADRPRFENVDLRTEVQAVVDFVGQEMQKREISVTTKFPRHSVTIRMDPRRLRQIMLNLLSNAADALSGKGRIDVAAHVRGGRAEITVADNGPGIPEADRQRIFEPFYTQKAEGTGLGLALVKRFVEECDGQIRCESNQLGGTTFRITLPETVHSFQPGVMK